MKSLIKRLPFFGPLARASYHRVRAARELPAARRMLRSAAHPAAAQVGRVLEALAADNPSSGMEKIAAIEKERSALLARPEPLIDGSLDQPGLYDEGVTIDSACRVSKPPNAARLMTLLIQEFRPSCVIELGTNVGISSAYQAAGLEANGDGGRLVTLEASPYRQRLARELHARVGLHNIDYRLGLFDDTLDVVVDEFGPFDFAFIDGHHQHEPTLDYFERIWRNALPGAVFVFDDIRWSEGMARAWAALQGDPRIELAVDLYTVGVCIVSRQAVTTGRSVLRPIRYALEEKA
jgi:predicted O-methyltransferase YrrM